MRNEPQKCAVEVGKNGYIKIKWAKSGQKQNNHQLSNLLYLLIISILDKSVNQYFVNPWGVEPQSKEPESFILSIELRVQMARLQPTLGWSGALWVEGHFG